jgi:hypothetical protein
VGILISWHGDGAFTVLGKHSLKNLSHVSCMTIFIYTKKVSLRLRQLVDPSPDSGDGWLILLIRIAIAFHWAGGEYHRCRNAFSI